MTELDTSHATSMDARYRSLHLLPALQIDPFDSVPLSALSLSVSVSWLDAPVSPPNGWIIRQPYPNRLYFVGGSGECHLGHLVTLPEEQQAGEIILHWKVSDTGLPSGHFQVMHRFDLSFAEGPGRTYSMDIANWWWKSEFANDNRRTPEIGHNRFSRLKPQGISPSRKARVEESIRDGCRYLDIYESLSLPPITLNDCWTIKTYGGESALNYLEALR